MQILLVGNPNCGKTTLFNALTGDNQRVGNWPGVTVEQKKGFFILNNENVELIDLPGVYSLSIDANHSAKDEQITAQALTDLTIDLIVNIVDACHLERNLYLTTQLLELGKPMIVVLNMMDLAEKQGITINQQALSEKLSCPVIALQAHKGIGLKALGRVMSNEYLSPSTWDLDVTPPLDNALKNLEKQVIYEGKPEKLAKYYAYRRLEAGQNSAFGEDLDILVADARYNAIHHLIALVQKKKSDIGDQITAKIDKIVLHRFWAFPIFFSLMYIMFLFAINIGGAFQDFFDISTDAIFVQGAAWVLQQIAAPNWLIAILANGLGKGINTTITFIPVIASMYFFLSALEVSGYMARAAFVVDKAMRYLGLPGKSFVPMIVGFGCNVPGIMAARTLDSERDRLLTILMSPFMSCSARLAIYAVFVAAFFPRGGQNIVFSLYIFGILMGVLTGFLLRKNLLQGESSPLILELPVYHRPSLKRLWKETGLRLKHFVWRAGKIIVPVCIILGALNALTLQGTMSTGEANAHSLLSYLGRWVTPIFAPMGLTADNWPATVGLITGTLAKEVVVGSLNALYAPLQETANISFDLLARLQEALWSIPHNLATLGSALLNPISASAPENEITQTVYGTMVQRFDGQAGAYAYLLFILLYIPCVSTMAVIRQESNGKMMWLSISWSFFLAYTVSVLFYQIARFNLHPQTSLFWILSLITVTAVGCVFLSQYGRKGVCNAIAT